MEERPLVGGKAWSAAGPVGLQDMLKNARGPFRARVEASTELPPEGDLGIDAVRFGYPNARKSTGNRLRSWRDYYLRQSCRASD